MICIIILRLFKLEVSSATKTLAMHTACSKIQMNTSGGNSISERHPSTCQWRMIMTRGWKHLLMDRAVPCLEHAFTLSIHPLYCDIPIIMARPIP